MGISVCTIAKNEETDIGNFIKNLLSWVDEIVIVDDNSCDRTVEIVNSFNNPKIKLISNSSKSESFSDKRNLALCNATEQWVLHMDIDERVTPSLRDELIAISQKDVKEVGFRYRRLNHFLHHPMKAGGWHKWNKVQFALNGKHKFINELHENLVFTGDEDVLVGQLEGLMWHLIDASYEERLLKHVKYSSAQARVITNVSFLHFRLMFEPFYVFIKSFLWNRGFVLGSSGLVFALYMALSRLNVLIFIWESRYSVSRNEIEERFNNLS